MYAYTKSDKQKSAIQLAEAITSALVEESVLYGAAGNRLFDLLVDAFCSSEMVTESQLVSCVDSFSAAQMRKERTPL